MGKTATNDLQETLEDCLEFLFGDDGSGDLGDDILDLPDNVIVLTDVDGQDAYFEFLDLIELDDDEYMVLIPVEGEESDDPSEVVILQVCDTDDPEVEAYVSLDDETRLTRIFEVFKERMKGVFNFVD